MLKQVDELTAEELIAFEKHEQLLVEIEKTAMTKSYKMVILKGFSIANLQILFNFVNVLKTLAL